MNMPWAIGECVSGAIQGKEQHLTLHLGVVVIKKGAFRLLSTMVCQLTYVPTRE